jgi:hypothetical protein
MIWLNIVVDKPFVWLIPILFGFQSEIYTTNIYEVFSFSVLQRVI